MGFHKARALYFYDGVYKKSAKLLFISICAFKYCTRKCLFKNLIYSCKSHKRHGYDSGSNESDGNSFHGFGNFG